MTVSAHGTRSVYAGATRQPLAPVRTVQVKRQHPGWLDCPVDEFLRLLALHEAGEINLLAMPETEANTGDDEPDDEDLEPPAATISRVNAGPQRLEAPALLRIRQAMRSTTKPMTTDAIARRSRLSQQSVSYILRMHMDEFECAGKEGHRKLWRRK